MMYNPENQMLKIIDFGSAVIYEGQENAQRRRVGTVQISLFSHIILLLRS